MADSDPEAGLSREALVTSPGYVCDKAHGECCPGTFSGRRSERPEIQSGGGVRRGGGACMTGTERSRRSPK